MSFFAPIGGFFANLGRNLGGAVKKPFDALVGTGGEAARTPSFVPESVGKDIGARVNTLPVVSEAVAGGITPRTPSVLPSGTNRPNSALLVRPKSLGGESVTPPNPIPELGRDPRMAGKDVRSEMAMRATDPNPEVVFRSPMEKARFDYVTKNGDPAETHRGFKAGVKDFFTAGAMANRELPANATLSERLGALLGGGTTGAIMGKKDPVGFEEQKFEAFQQPRLYRDMMIQNENEKMRADIAYKNAQAQREAHQQGIAERGMVLKEKEFNQPEWMSPVSVDQNGNPVLLQTNRKGGDYRVLGSDAGIINQNARAEADRKARADIAATTQKGQDTRLDKTLKTRKEIAQGAQAVQVYKHNNPNTGQGGGGGQQAAALEKKWASARKRANDETLTQEERNAAFNEAEAAAAEIKQKYGHLYDTDGQGGWSYVRRKPAGAATQGPKGAVDVERYVSDAIKAGATREQALQHLRDRGFLQ